MKNFKNYMYCNSEFRDYGKVWHNKEFKEAVFTDGHIMIISKELFDESKDVEQIKKSKDKEWHVVNYRNVVYSKEDLIEIDAELFKSEIYLADENVFFADLPYDKCLENKVMFEDFGFCLSAPIIHAVNTFINDNKNLDMKVFVNKEDITRPIQIEVYSDDFFHNGEVLNLMCFVVVRSGYDYQIMIKNNELLKINGVFQKDIEHLYSWSDMANDLTSHGIPHGIMYNLADMELAMVLNRPILSIYKFDDWLHEKYGNYESQGKSMKDMFKELFGDDADKIAWYFGVETEDYSKYYKNPNKVGN